MNTDPQTIVITGHTSGLGHALLQTFLAMGWRVVGIADSEEPPEGSPPANVEGGQFFHLSYDLCFTEPDEIGQWLELEMGITRIDALINCAGINHLTTFESLRGGDWERVMDLNAKAIWQLTQGLLPYLTERSDTGERGTVLNIVSNAAHVPMTHSLVYNASKAAALMITHQMARELFKTHGLTVFAISPNKLAGTGMSRYIEESVPALRGWTAEEAAEYQRAALPIGEETSPLALAEFIGFLLSTKERHRYLHGCNIPYGC